MDNALLRREEQAVLSLRSLYRSRGYLPFTMSKFEEYELYARNKDFLLSDRVLTFTDTNGRLMALKPDVTLSIVRRGEDKPGVKQKLCYDERVYRPVHNGPFREITQVGLECLGDLDSYDRFEVVSLAARSLNGFSENYVLAVNHLALLTTLLDSLTPDESLRRELEGCVAGKNEHDLHRLAAGHGLDAAATERLCGCMRLFGPVAGCLECLRGSCDGPALRELETLVELLEESGEAGHVVFDFSLVSDRRYYSGLVFRGYVPGVSESVLAGGEYDNLMRRMGRRGGGLGFAVYLDRLERLGGTAERWDVDVLLLYDDAVSPSALAHEVQRLTGAGKRVSAQKAIPERLRFRELLDLRGEAAE